MQIHWRQDWIEQLYKGGCAQGKVFFTIMTASPEPSIAHHDSLVHWRCRQLGGEVTFRYCRKLADGLPCTHVVSCWQTVFDVKAFLEAHYDIAQLAAAWNRPRPDKTVHLADLIARARGNG